ncbi:hypothetical protein Cgig2_004116 [Carnegiea gigantea]|uniref:Strictosidine synthase conserved region domain-containing protein n=1 Tax=Carnegiea gigantea TaxID=171969 RepID=A0A9Q1KUH3_9CARY|nr:hypothetical protein Cgig2_004116 [Carnegiea gigantea]
MSEVVTESVGASDRKRSVLWSYAVFLTVIVPIALAVVFYRVDPFDPAELPLHELAQQDLVVPRVNDRLLHGSEFIGSGQMLGPEDIAFEPESGVIYTGCADGWVKRVKVNDSVSDSVVENWVYTGGRPLGLVLGLNNEVIVADAFKGLLNLSRNGNMELLTDEVEGRKLKFADGVDVAKDGMIYFTEASYKYDLSGFIWDVFEGKPHGSLMSFDPTTRRTKVLVRNLYFPNGVQVSPDQKSVIFCETVMRRCKKYIREGEREGSVDMFVDNLVGVPDNIRYDGEEHYWIAFSTSVKPYWDIAFKYPLVRKILAIVTRYIGRPQMEKNGGLLAIDMEGKPIAHYYDPKLSMISGGNKIGRHLYIGFLHHPYIMRLNLDQHAAS